MWPFRKKTRQRRVEVHDSLPARMRETFARFRQAGGLPALAVAVAFYAVAGLLDVFPIDPVPYRPGQYVPEPIRARVAFKRPDPYLLEDEYDRIKSATPATFRLNTSLVTDQIIPTLRKLPNRLRAATQPSTEDENLRKAFALSSDAAVREFWEALAEVDRARYERSVEALKDKLMLTCIVPHAQAVEQRKRAATKVVLTHPLGRTTIDIEDLISLQKPERISHRAGVLAQAFDPAIQVYIRAYLLNVLSGNDATYLYDGEATEKTISAAIALLSSAPPEHVFEHFRAGDVLAPASGADGSTGWDIQGLSEQHYRLLQAERAKYVEIQQQTAPWRARLRIVGRAMLLALLIAALCLYVLRYQPHLARQLGKGLKLAMTLAVMLAIAKLVVHGLEWNVHAAVLPVLMASMIVTIALGRRFALTIGTAMAVLVTLQMRAPLPVLIVLISGALAGVFPLDEVRTRTKLVRVSCFSAIVVLAAVWAVNLSMNVPWRFALIDGLWGAGMALLAGFLVQGVLPMVEKSFSVATSMTLLEWCDASRPLLKRLAMEAPGTYNHSLQLGAICEAAAETIGARGLLARVGAYYHDIGKINKPTYFVENESGGGSRHAKLSPAMSLLIIIGHVKDGLEMAREYGLPEVLHEFITTHHGTTLVQYFYKAAAEQRKEGSDRAPDEVEFRYPGPKPRRKETAILMLADASESSVRAMSEPTPGRIENQVHTMISRRLMDGQLDECDLTLKEVHQIEMSIIKSLCSIFHSRIAYPTPPGETPSAAEMDGERQAARQEARREEEAAAHQANPDQDQPAPMPSAAMNPAQQFPAPTDLPAE
ncbi:MAG: HD family phosphohydrolase [Phycisphaerae bacterium]